MATTRQAAPRGKELPWLYRDRYQRRPQPPPYRTSLRGGARRVPQPNSEPSFADESDERIDDKELMGRSLALWHGSASRAGVFALCAWSGLSYEDAAVALQIPSEPCALASRVPVPVLRELDPGIGHEEDKMQCRGDSRVIAADYRSRPVATYAARWPGAASTSSLSR